MTSPLTSMARGKGLGGRKKDSTWALPRTSHFPLHAYTSPPPLGRHGGEEDHLTLCLYLPHTFPLHTHTRFAHWHFYLHRLYPLLHWHSTPAATAIARSCRRRRRAGWHSWRRGRREEDRSTGQGGREEDGTADKPLRAMVQHETSSSGAPGQAHAHSHSNL